MDKIILIPIGGVGSRFKQNNYKKPKALVNIFGKPLIYYLLSNLTLDSRTLVYIIYNHEYYQYRFEDMLIKQYPHILFKFHHLLTSTDGAAETINIALKNINLSYDLPILCLDSDNFYTEDIIHKWNKQNAVLFFKSECIDPIYSYILYNEYKQPGDKHDVRYNITDIKEKEKISDSACCGGYGFKSYTLLLKYTELILNKKIKFKNEYYTSVCIKHMLNDGIMFDAIEVSKNNYHCIGTPLQLKLFYNNKPNVSCISNVKQTETLRFCFDLDNTLVSYPKITNDYSSVIPIEKNIAMLRYLKAFGNTIIIYTARRMKTHNGNEGKILADVGKITFDTLDKFQIPYDELHFGKPHADFYIDDNAINAFDDIEKEIGFYQDSIKPRDFNSIESSSINIYTKRSGDLSGEIYYYTHIPNEIKDIFPLMIDSCYDKTWYQVEKVIGLTMSNLYVSELLTFNILTSVMKSIRRIHAVTVVSDATNIYENYKNKLKKRYSEYNYTSFANSVDLYNILYRGLDAYETMNKGRKVCIHGDPVFTNIIINQYDKIKFIDMRGKQGESLTLYGDWLYDWAKMYQSLIGYDEILLNKEVNKEYKLSMINKFEETFLQWFSKEDFINLKLITNSLLFTLIPLHDNEKCIKFYNLIMQPTIFGEVKNDV
jgi:capsule biosynthesis phosphatase